MEELVFLGRFIKIQRERLNINISKLAYKSNYSRSYISQIECGKISFSENLESAVYIIFRCLNMNYDVYKQSAIYLQSDIDELFNNIFFILPEKRDILYHKLIKKERDITSYNFFHRYCLCKFVYNNTINNGIGSELDELKKILMDNKDIFTLSEQAFLYTYVGVYYRNKSDLKKSEYYLEKALVYGDFIIISGITYYHLAVTQSLANSLVSAYANIQNANIKFINDKNYKRLIYSQAQEAIILSRSKDYTKAIKIFKNLLTHNELSNSIKNAITINLAQANLSLKKYEEVEKILDNIDIITDNIIFIRLNLFFQKSDIDAFNQHYNSYSDKIENIIFKQQSLILYMKMNKLHNCDIYINLLHDSYSKIELKYDFDTEIFILNELIEFYESTGKYKISCKYLKKKIELLSM